jgi:hypothetical protein
VSEQPPGAVPDLEAFTVIPHRSGLNRVVARYPDDGKYQVTEISFPEGAEVSLAEIIRSFEQGTDRARSDG